MTIRKRLWTPAEAPPPDARPFVYKLANDKLAYSAPGATLKADCIDESRMGAAAVMSTPAVDRVGDIVHSDGCVLTQYRINDTWDFGHFLDPIPVGRAHYKDGPLEVHPSKEMVWGWCFFDQGRPEGVQYFRLVKDGILTAVSVMFDPIGETLRVHHPDGRSGTEYRSWHLLSCAWCGTPCHPQAGRMDVVLQDRAGLLRSYLERGEIEGAKLSQVVKKALEPLALPKNRSAPKFAGPTLHPDRPTGQTAPHRTNEATPMQKQKAMNEADGAAGGYSVQTPVVEKPDGGNPPNEEGQVKAAIKAVMEAHAGDAHPDGPHSAFFHSEAKGVHHQHHKDASPDHLAAVAKDLGDIPGVQSVRQATAAPEGEGWEFVHGTPIHSDEQHHTPSPANEEGEQKAFLRKAAQLDALFRGMPAKAFRAVLREARKTLMRKDAHADCMGRKIELLAREGYDDDAQRVAIAYAHCGEKKDLDPDAVAGAEDGGAEKVPHGVALCQELCEMIEGELEAMEPEVREFAELALQDIKDFAEARYPDHAFGGEQAKDQTADHAPADAVAEYQTPPPLPKALKPRGWFKHYAELKRLRKAHHAVMKDATDHLGELADKQPGDRLTRSEVTATKSHHGSMCKVMKELEVGPTEEDEPGELPAKSLPDFTAVIESAVSERFAAMADEMRDARYKRFGKYEDRPVAN